MKVPNLFLAYRAINKMNTIKLGLIFFFLFISFRFVHAQRSEVDSLLHIISKQKQDKQEVNAFAHLALILENKDSAVRCAERGLKLAEKIGDLKGKADCYLVLTLIYGAAPDLSRTIQDGLNALKIYEQINFKTGISSAHASLQANFRQIGDYRTALDHAFSGLKIALADQGISEFIIAGHTLVAPLYAELGQTYLLMNQLDSASYFTEKAIEQKELFGNAEWNFPVYLEATIQNMLQKYADAIINYRKALTLAVQNGLAYDTLQIQAGMSTLFKNTGQLDSAIHYAQLVVQGWGNRSEYKNLSEAVLNLAQSYRLIGNKDSVLRYVEFSQSIKDSIFTSEKNREVQRMAFNEKLRQQQIAAAQLRYKNRVQLYSLLGGILVLVLFAGILWRNNRHKQKANTQIKLAYDHLKATQAQLIHSEKMASLGEMSAGIAHEIQNPLNFVNNFSEVNDELLKELKAEAEKGNLDEVKAIAKDIAFNSEKINHHGKRADAIVKGMLQHSRSSSGQKEPTNINALSDEYLRLAYHGLRAKDKSFNANMQTDFDETIGNINIVPQDIGRVILNLINNAFYAVDEKKKKTGDASPDDPVGRGYEPTVSVSTKKEKDKIEIKVTDNGGGIPQKILDKIFQPFFTTKPTGQGTGLGLSLSYDIVKAHGGELKVETKEDEGSVFIIQLPQ